MYLSLILPCYNEGNKLKDNIPRITKFLDANLKKDYEIIIVNDGSTDDTKKYIQEILNDFKCVKIISYKKNRGKGHAVNLGLNAATGTYSIFMDTDLSTDLIAITDSLKYLENNFDCVIGSRKVKGSIIPIKRSFTRNMFSFINAALVNVLFNLKIKDTQCGFKAFKTDILKKFILEKQKINKFAFDIEYLYIMRLKDISIKEIPVIWTDDFDSRVSTLSSVVFFLDMLKIRTNKTYYK